MLKLIQRFKDSIEGVIHGFDRIVFQGHLMPLNFPDGAMSFFRRNGILFKDAKRWVEERSTELIESIEKRVQKECGTGITPILSSQTRKEALAREHQRNTGRDTGLIGAWSCVEACSSYRIIPAKFCPTLRPVQTRCKHIYLYLDDHRYGFMNIRIQTWFPYRIQVAMNGREWLARQLDKAGVEYERQRNKFTHLDDFNKAQRLLDRQLETQWCDMLDGFLPLVFPTMNRTVGPDLSYTWVCWQSEWASDFIFRDRHSLDNAMPGYARHAFLSGHAGRLFRFFGRPVNKNDQPHRNYRGNIQSRVLDTAEGFCIRHWIDRNSVKHYNEHNVMRIESTMNDPKKFKVNRRKQGASKRKPREKLPLRKGVADLKLRASVCQGINSRYADHLASMESSTPLEKILAPVLRKKMIDGRSVRALDPLGKDRPVLEAIADPKFSVSGFTNKDIREALGKHSAFRNKTTKQIAGAVTRLIRMLRDHGLIRKFPSQNRYALTRHGAEITTLVHAALAASIKVLSDIAA